MHAGKVLFDCFAHVYHFAYQDSIDAQSTVASRPGRGAVVEGGDRPVRPGLRGFGPTSPWYDNRSTSSMAAADGFSRQPGSATGTLTSVYRRGVVPWNNCRSGGSTTTAPGVGGPVEMGIRSIETHADYTIIETVEIVKRPGQTLGFYIREGNGIDRSDGVFISRIAPCSVVEKNGLLRVGEEIIAVDGVDITRMSLDDVVILMSLPRRLLLTVRTRKSCCSKNLSCPALLATPTGETVAVSGQQPIEAALMVGGQQATCGGGERREHQRHWSTASVVDLTDNYAEQPQNATMLGSDTLRRRVGSPGHEATASLRRGGQKHVVVAPESEYPTLSRRTAEGHPEMVVPVEVHRQVPQQTTPGARRKQTGTESKGSDSWDRRSAAVRDTVLTSSAIGSLLFETHYCVFISIHL